MHSRFVTSIRDDPCFTLTTIIYVVLDLEHGLANTLHDLWRPRGQRRQYVYTRKRRSRTTDGRTTSKGRCWSFCGTAVNSSASCARMTSSVNNNPPIRFEAGSPGPLQANLVLEDTWEKIYHTNLWAEKHVGLFLIRGENVVLMGEIVRILSPVVCAMRSDASNRTLIAKTMCRCGKYHTQRSSRIIARS